MKRLLIILFFIPFLISAQTIYQTGFETGFDGWKTPETNHLDRLGVTYGIHPVGSFMLYCYNRYICCNRKLNLKSGRTYNFSFKYNNSYSSLRDTLFISNDSIPYANSIALSGTSKIGLTTVRPGTGDQNWHVVNFSVTPTENGGYWHLSFFNSSEAFVDSMTVTGDTSGTAKRLRIRK